VLFFSLRYRRGPFLTPRVSHKLLYCFSLLYTHMSEEKDSGSDDEGAVARVKPGPPVVVQLTQEEIDDCRVTFAKFNNGRKKFDKYEGGTIDLWGLRNVLEAMGQTPSEADVFSMIIEAEEDSTGSINFAEFLHIIEQQKLRALNVDKLSDLMDAYIACGGDEDLGGCVKRETLVQIVKEEFGLPIDIEELINQIDADGSGEIEFDEFEQLLSS